MGLWSSLARALGGGQPDANLIDQADRMYDRDDGIKQQLLGIVQRLPCGSDAELNPQTFLVGEPGADLKLAVEELTSEADGREPLVLSSRDLTRRHQEMFPQETDEKKIAARVDRWMARALTDSAIADNCPIVVQHDGHDGPERTAAVARQAKALEQAEVGTGGTPRELRVVLAAPGEAVLQHLAQYQLACEQVLEKASAGQPRASRAEGFPANADPYRSPLAVQGRSQPAPTTPISPNPATPATSIRYPPFQPYVPPQKDALQQLLTSEVRYHNLQEGDHNPEGAFARASIAIPSTGTSQIIYYDSRDSEQAIAQQSAAQAKHSQEAFQRRDAIHDLAMGVQIKRHFNVEMQSTIWQWASRRSIGAI